MKKANGFTLVELLIVIAIVALIGGMISLRFTGTNSKTAVKNVTLTLAAQIKEARSRTVAGQTNGTASSWGVVIEPTTGHAYLFGDTDADGEYSTGDTVTEPIFLDDKATIASCQINGTDVTRCGVLFSSPGAQASFFLTGTAPATPWETLSVNIRGVQDKSMYNQVTIIAPSGVVVTNEQP